MKIWSNDDINFLKDNKLVYNCLLKDYTEHMKLKKETDKKNNFNNILEMRNFYRNNDIVLIEYWYLDIICPVKIIGKIKNKYIVSHNIPDSKIFNAPDEIIKSSDIIDIKR